MGLVSGPGSLPEEQRLNGLAVELASVLLNGTTGQFESAVSRNCFYLSFFRDSGPACWVATQFCERRHLTFADAYRIIIELNSAQGQSVQEEDRAVKFSR